MDITVLVLFRESGDNGLFIILVPKVYDNVFLFVGLTTLETYTEFWLVGLLNWVL